MTTADKHQLRIARQTLRMSDVMIPVMGGMTKTEAERIVAAHDAKQRVRRNTHARARHDAYTSCGMKRTPYGYE